MQQEIGGALKRSTASQADEVLVNQLLLASCQPCDVERQRWQPAVEVPQFGAGKYAQDQRRERLDGVLHLVHQSTLQPEHICGQGIVENLPATVVEHLVAKGPAA